MKTNSILTRWPCLAVALGCSVFCPAWAASDYFLKIDKIPGEVVDSRHGGEIEVLSWSFGASNPAILSGGGTTAGKVSMSPFTVRKRIDKSSPLLKLACASGQHIPRATITLRNRSRTQVEYAHVVLENVNVAGILIGLSVGAEPTDESVALNFTRIGIEYFTIVNDKPGERTAFAWDLPENREGGVTFPSENPDADNDGMPDSWESFYGVTDPRADNDRDGATNWEEYVAGTSPVDANKVFRSTLNFVPGSANATLTWSSAAGKTYRILVTGALGSAFNTLTTVNSGGDGTTSFTLPPSALNQFFRVEVAQ